LLIGISIPDAAHMLEQAMQNLVWVVMTGVLVALAVAGGCTAADSGGIVQQALPGGGSSSFEDAVGSFRLAAGEGLISAEGFQCRVIHGLRLHPDGTAETWMIGGVQNETPAWFTSAGGGWREIRFSGPLPEEACHPGGVVHPDRLFALHASAVERIFAESDHPPVLILASGRWELAGARGPERLLLIVDAATGERITP